MILTINLLPWRDMQRQALRRYFFIKLAFTFLAVLFVTLMLRQIQSVRLDAQTTRNDILQQEITLLSSTLNTFSRKELVRDTLQKRLELVNALQKQRNNATLLLNLLPEVMPEGVVLYKVAMTAGKVKVEGRSRSNAQLAHFLARLEEEKGVHDVQMHSILNSTDPFNQMEKQFRATFELTGFIVPNLPEEKGRGS